MTDMVVQWLGRMAYREALDLQEAKVRERLEGAIPDTLLLLEHEPVYTIGRSRDRSSLGTDPAALPHPLFEITRGGLATYHGPGQLVGYPIINLRGYKPDLHAYLRALEDSLITLCAAFGLAATRRDRLTGVWIDVRKIASIGVGVRRWITLHGFALNVSNDLGPFQAIVPCGIAQVCMTSLETECPDASISVQEVAEAYPDHLHAALARM